MRVKLKDEENIKKMAAYLVEGQGGQSFKTQKKEKASWSNFFLRDHLNLMASGTVLGDQLKKKRGR